MRWMRHDNLLHGRRRFGGGTCAREILPRGALDRKMHEANRILGFNVDHFTCIGEEDIYSFQKKIPIIL
jgi:hypothetical protein